MLDIKKIVDDFEYNGEFLNNNDLLELLEGYDFENFNELLDYLNDNDDNYIGDQISNLSNRKKDIYYYNLRQWAVNNYTYIEEGVDEFGIETPFDFHKAIQIGQYYAYNKEFYLMIDKFADYIRS